MSINDLISTTTVVQGAAPSQRGFGVPLILAQEVPVAFTNRVREYADLTEMVSDGFSTTKAPYLAAAKAFAQTPRPPKVKIGRRALTTTKTIKLKCLSAVVGVTYLVTVVFQGTANEMTYTVASGTTTDVATAIAALIDAYAGVAATSSTDTITITASGGAGVLFSLKDWTREYFYLTDTSADPGIATDLAAVRVEDDDWYGLTIDSESKAEILAAALAAESAKKLFVAQTSESTVIDNGVSNDVASSVEAAAYRQTALIFNGNDTMGFSGAAWQGERFAGTPTPGNETWVYKTLAGVTTDTITSTERSTALGKKCSVYETVLGKNITEGGLVGSGEHIDVIRFLAWVDDQIQVRLFQLETSNPKIAFTQKGIAVCGGVVKSVLVDGETNQGFAEGSSQVFPPDIADVSSTDKANRRLRNLDWAATLAGAIEIIDARGFVSV